MAIKFLFIEPGKQGKGHISSTTNTNQHQSSPLLSTPIHSHTSSSSVRSSAPNHNNQQANRRSRSRTRSKDSSNLLSTNLTLTSNDHPAYHCQQHNPPNIFNNSGIDSANQPLSDATKNEQQSSLDISKRVVNRVESLRQFLLHGKLTHNQQEHQQVSNSCSAPHGDGIHEPNGSVAQFNSQHHGMVGTTSSLQNSGNTATDHSQCSCRPHANGGVPTQGFVAHRQAAFLAAANGAMANTNQFRPGLAHTRRRSKSSERLGGGPPRLSIAASPAFMATALPNGPHHPQLFAAPPFLFATFNPQEVVR
jgi:hypothetical protein